MRKKPKVVSKFDMYFWHEFLCLSELGSRRWLLDIRMHDLYGGDASEFVDEETGELLIPDRLEGCKVIDEQDGAIYLDRLVPHQNEETAKLRYVFETFDWQEFQRIFEKYEADCFTDLIKQRIEKAVAIRQ